jgi:hypothetical protein
MKNQQTTSTNNKHRSKTIKYQHKHIKANIKQILLKKNHINNLKIAKLNVEKQKTTLQCLLLHVLRSQSVRIREIIKLKSTTLKYV